MQINEKSKLIIITRRDLSPGAQAAQSVHAAEQFQKEHDNVQSEWYFKSRHIVILSCDNEKSLKELLLKAHTRGILCSAFSEPDFNDALTAIALEPSEEAQKLTSNLPLAFREYTTAFQNFHGKEVAGGK